MKPRLRGVSHEWAFFVSLVAGAALVVTAPSGRAAAAAAIYAGSLSALLGVSALYHRINWRRPETRRWMRRLDHSMIFLLIAGTVTPVCAPGPRRGAGKRAPDRGLGRGRGRDRRRDGLGRGAEVGGGGRLLAVGWIGALGFPAIVIEAGLGAGILIAVGGILYTAGAVVYARQRPDPNPAVFGYHEIFHVLVIAAAAAHFAAIAIYALPAS